MHLNTKVFFFLHFILFILLGGGGGGLIAYLYTGVHCTCLVSGLHITGFGQAQKVSSWAVTCISASARSYYMYCKCCPVEQRSLDTMFPPSVNPGSFNGMGAPLFLASAILPTSPSSIRWRSPRVCAKFTWMIDGQATTSEPVGGQSYRRVPRSRVRWNGIPWMGESELINQIFRRKLQDWNDTWTLGILCVSLQYGVHVHVPVGFCWFRCRFITLWPVLEMHTAVNILNICSW